MRVVPAPGVQPGRDGEPRVVTESRVHFESLGTAFLYRVGQTLFWEGEPCGGVYRIETGTVVLSRFGPAESTGVVGLRHAGDTLGYLTAMTEGLHANTVLASTDCRVRYIDRESLKWLVSRLPELEQELLREAVARHGAVEEHLVASRVLPLRARLASALLALRSQYAEVDSDGCLRFELPLSRKLLASWLGARPESLSRAIRELERDGVAAFHGRRVRVDDLDGLLDEVEGTTPA